MNQQEVLEKNKEEILTQEDAEKYIWIYQESREKQRKKYGIRCFLGAAIIGILGVWICVWKSLNVYLGCLMLVELLVLAFVLQIVLKRENQKKINTIKPYGNRKLVFVKTLDKNEPVFAYIYVKDKEIKKVEESNICVLDSVKEGEYATLIELEENNKFLSNDINWAVIEERI